MENKVYFEQFWRNAKLEDAIKQPSMVGRYKNNNGDWEIFNLTGYDSGPEISSHHWIFSNCCSDNAQVYDPPANFDLGDGYEFVDAKKEPNAKGVEFWWHNANWDRGCWEKRPDYYGKLTGFDIYRRKIKKQYRLMQSNEIIHSGCLVNHKNNDQSLNPIAPGWMQSAGWTIGTIANNHELNFACPIGEPIESYEPFTWDDRYELIDKLISCKAGKRLISINKITSDGDSLLANCISAKALVENYAFDDTKLPVGKKVTKIA